MDNQSYSLSVGAVADLLDVTRQAVSQIFKNKAGASRDGKKLTSVSPLEIRHFLETSRGYKYKKQAIAFQIIKGGVGKSSLSKNFAIRASMYGYKTCLIDFDHQLNLTVSMDAFKENQPVWIDYLKRKVASIFDIVVPISSHLSIIPSSPTNCLLDKEIILGSANLSTLIASPIGQLLTEFDLVVCDCPPALSHLTHAIYLAVDRIISPVKPDIYSKIGLEQVFTQWNELSENYKKVPEISVVVNLYDPRKKASTACLQDFFANYSKYMLPNLIKSSADFDSTMENREHLWSKKTQAGSAAEEVDLMVKHILNLYDVTSANKKDGLQEVGEAV